MRNYSLFFLFVQQHLKQVEIDNKDSGSGSILFITFSKEVLYEEMVVVAN